MATKKTIPKIEKAWFYHPRIKDVLVVTISSMIIENGNPLYEIMYEDKTGQKYVAYVPRKALIFTE